MVFFCNILQERCNSINLSFSSSSLEQSLKMAATNIPLSLSVTFKNPKIILNRLYPFTSLTSITIYISAKAIGQNWSARWKHALEDVTQTVLWTYLSTRSDLASNNKSNAHSHASPLSLSLSRAVDRQVGRCTHVNARGGWIAHNYPLSDTEIYVWIAHVTNGWPAPPEIH